MQEVYINGETINFKCKNCGESRILQTRATPTEFDTVMCEGCGEVTDIHVNKRGFYRKKMRGATGELNLNGKRVSIYIDDLSMSGLCGHFLNKHAGVVLDKGVVIKVTYTVGEGNGIKEILDVIKIRWIKFEGHITIFGGKCMNNQEYSKHDKDKGFFLRP